jgi:hypothetical protein
MTISKPSKESLWPWVPCLLPGTSTGLPIADHMMKNYDGVLKVDGEVGNEKTYDPRVYMKLNETSMAERVKQAVKALRSEGTALFEG